MKNLLGKLLGREKTGSKNVSTDKQETIDRLGGVMTKLPDGSWVMKSYNQETKTSDLGLPGSPGLFCHLGTDGFIFKDTFYILDYINRAKKIALDQMTNGDELSKISGVKFEYDRQFPENGPTVVVIIENDIGEDGEGDGGDEFESGYGKAISIIDDKILNKIPEGKLIKEHAKEIITYLNGWAMKNNIYDKSPVDIESA